jgi:hypothetical protein
MSRKELERKLRAKQGVIDNLISILAEYRKEKNKLELEVSRLQTLSNLNKVTTPHKKKVVYLGEMTWEVAVEKALDMGMQLPRESLMRLLIRHMGIKNYSPPTSDFLTSTVRLNDARLFKPVPMSDSDETTYNRNTYIGKAFAVPIGMTEEDILSGNFYVIGMTKNGELYEGKA